jgi:hypothetical protein
MMGATTLAPTSPPYERFEISNGSSNQDIQRRNLDVSISISIFGPELSRLWCELSPAKQVTPRRLAMVVGKGPFRALRLRLTLVDMGKSKLRGVCQAPV